MKKTFYITYAGYCGDKHWWHMQSKQRLEEILGATVTCFNYFNYLTQKGFGPGYFNNSGRYFASFKVITNEENVKKLTSIWNSSDFTFYDDPILFKERVKEVRNHSKIMRKQNPY